MKAVFVLLIAVIFLPTTFYAEGQRKVIVAHRINTSITIDGLLDEPAWEKAQPVTDFTQYDPDEGALPTEHTVVMVVYDDNALYIGAILFDSDPDGIVGRLARRDRHTFADRFDVIIDSNFDRITAHQFSVNVSNVQRDGVYMNDGAQFDVTWDAVWESATARIRRGWSVEMRIPFSALRFDRTDGEYVWGVNFRRHIIRKQERVDWVMVPRREAGFVSRFGELRGIRDVDPPLYIQLLPYVSTQGRRQSEGLPQVSENDFNGNIGLDMKVGLSSNTTLDLAVNPDFGQVEIDQTIINLTAFETFYPEKRPFFLEGAELFRFGSTFVGTQLRLFYSRRIGRRPPQPGIGGDERFIEIPQATTILGSAKIISRTPGGLSIGALSALTNKEEAIIENVDGDRRSVEVQPRGSYNVFRMRQEVLENSAVGMMFTSVLREGIRPAVSGGIDWNLRLKDNTYFIDGFLAGSRTERTGKIHEGTAGRFYFVRPGGYHWWGSFNYEYFSPDFNINDIGFQERADYHGGWFDIYYKNDFARKPFRRYFIRWAAESRWNFDGYGIKQDTQLMFLSQFTNFYEGLVSYKFNFASYDDFETRGMDLYYRPDYHTLEAWLSTDQRKKIIAYPHIIYQWNDTGWREYYLSFDFDFRPTPAVEISPRVGLYRALNYEAWIDNIYDPELEWISLFGDRDVDQVDLSIRGIVTMSPNLSIQFFTQMFYAKVWYEDVRFLVDPKMLQTYQQFADDHPFDYNYHGFNANIILRWEYTRGSTIYLVWTQGRFGFHSRIHQPFRDTFRDTFRTPMDNVFFIKFNYWFSV